MVNEIAATPQISDTMLICMVMLSTGPTNIWLKCSVFLYVHMTRWIDAQALIPTYMAVDVIHIDTRGFSDHGAFRISGVNIFLILLSLENPFTDFNK